MEHENVAAIDRQCTEKHSLQHVYSLQLVPVSRFAMASIDVYNHHVHVRDEN